MINLNQLLNYKKLNVYIKIRLIKYILLSLINLLLITIFKYYTFLFFMRTNIFNFQII